MNDTIDVDRIKEMLQEFADARNWNQYHNPKNLSMSLASEAGELLEIFRWMPEAESNQALQNPELKEKTALELADICINLIRLAGLMQINLSQAVLRKIEMIKEKYPEEKVKGSYKKYDEYGDPST